MENESKEKTYEEAIDDLNKSEAHDKKEKSYEETADDNYGFDSSDDPDIIEVDW